jgi:glycosyltransferase involved in cell wall biosynthesis
MFYGVENSVVDCDEQYQVLSDAERRACYGDYNWDKEFFKHDGQDAAYTAFNKNAVTEINKRKQPQDFLLLPMGHYNKAVADGVGGVAAVESGIGYSGVFASYRVWESYSWMMHVYGMLRQNDGSWYDAVIPNYFDPNDFPLCEEKEDYLLYTGRVIKRKGVEVASQVSKYLGKRLVIAGQGGLISASEGIDLSHEKHIDYIGTIGPEKRKEVMGKAILSFVPTYYIEPFGGVAVESMMCGTPVLTSDWGVFSETVRHGVTGFRCRTFDDFIFGARQIMDGKIDSKDCNKWAVDNFSMDRVKLMYQEYFLKVHDVITPNCGQWYRIHRNRKDLDWLRKYY